MGASCGVIYRRFSISVICSVGKPSAVSAEDVDEKRNILDRVLSTESTALNPSTGLLQKVTQFHNLTTGYYVENGKHF